MESGHVNGYLQETTGEPFTAKDFRTWGGTVTAAEVLAAHDGVEEGTQDGLITQAIKATAARLGNTPAVCRQYYVHPDVLDAFRARDLRGRLVRRNAGNTPEGLRPPRGRRARPLGGARGLAPGLRRRQARMARKAASCAASSNSARVGTANPPATALPSVAPASVSR